MFSSMYRYAVQCTPKSDCVIQLVETGIGVVGLEMTHGGGKTEKSVTFFEKNNNA